MIDFPDNPTLDMVFPAGGKTWKWNGTAWIGAIGNNSVTWDNLPGRPVDFPPSAHSHDGISSQDATATLGIQNNGSLIISDGGIATTLTNTSTEARTIALPNKNGVLATTEDIVNADWNAVSGATQILNKPSLDFATTAQGAKADSALQSGAAISSISGLQASLDGKQAAGSYATAAQGTKADSASQPGHGHSLTDITVSGATNGQVAAWNGTAWVPSTPAASGVSSVAGRDGAVTLTVGDIANAVGSVTTNIPNATPITNMMQITSGGYSALGTNVSVNTLYIIVG